MLDGDDDTQLSATFHPLIDDDEKFSPMRFGAIHIQGRTHETGGSLLHNIIFDKSNRFDRQGVFEGLAGCFCFSLHLFVLALQLFCS